MLAPLVEELALLLGASGEDAPKVFAAMLAERTRGRFETGLTVRQALRELGALERALDETWTRRHGSMPPEIVRLVATLFGEAAAELAHVGVEVLARRREGPLEAALAEEREAAERLEAELRRADRELYVLHARLLRLGHERSIGDLVAGTALALNNELNALALSVRLLAGSGPGADGERHLAAIDAAARRAAERVARLQELVVPQVPGGPRAVDLNSSVVEALDLVRPELTAAARDRSLRVDARLGSVGAVRAHGVELREVLCKLLIAARDRMPEGGLLRVSTRPAGSGYEVVLSHPAGSAPSEETLLTLEAARERARHWEGELVAERDGENEGLRLRLQAAEAPAPAEPPERSARHGAPRHVLIVDDDPDNREALGELLSLTGFDVDDAGSGEEALTRAAVRAYDAALLDLAMPGMNGLELARRLRALDANLRIALVTGWEPGSTAVEPGVVDAIFHKPIDLSAIQAFLSPEPDVQA